MRAIAILVVMLTLLFLGGQAKAEKSLGELKVDCEELENFWRLYPPTKDSTEFQGKPERQFALATWMPSLV